MRLADLPPSAYPLTIAMFGERGEEFFGQLVVGPPDDDYPLAYKVLPVARVELRCANGEVIKADVVWIGERIGERLRHQLAICFVAMFAFVGSLFMGSFYSRILAVTSWIGTAVSVKFLLANHADMRQIVRGNGVQLRRCNGEASGGAGVN
jgi:hypothetical protein